MRCLSPLARRWIPKTTFPCPSAIWAIAVIVVDGLGHGEHRPYVIGEFVAVIVIGYFFVRRQLAQSAPLLSVDLLRIPVFALSIGTSICSFCAPMLVFVSPPFLLQNGFGMTQLETGFLMTPWPLVIVFVAPLSGMARGQAFGGAARQHRTRDSHHRPRAARNRRRAPDDRRYRVAHGRVRVGLRAVAQQQADAVCRTAASQRRRERHALGTARLTGQTLGAAFVALIFGVAPQPGPLIALGRQPLSCGWCGRQPASACGQAQRRDGLNARTLPFFGHTLCYRYDEVSACRGAFE